MAVDGRFPSEGELGERAEKWLSTMRGHHHDGVAFAHEDSWAGPGIQQSFPAKSAKNDKTARSHALQPAHTAPVREWSKNRLIPFVRASNVIVTASCMHQHFVVLPAKPKSLSFLTIINVRASPTRSK